MKMLSKKAVQRLLSVLMIFALCISVGVTAQAVPKIQKEEPFPEGMTEEERNKEEKKRQKQIYDMPVQTNEIPNWPLWRWKTAQRKIRLCFLMTAYLFSSPEIPP